jgi:hypothetical protein
LNIIIRFARAEAANTLPQLTANVIARITATREIFDSGEGKQLLRRGGHFILTISAPILNMSLPDSFI